MRRRQTPAQGSGTPPRSPPRDRDQDGSDSGSSSSSSSSDDDLRRDALRNSVAAAAVGAPLRKRGAARAHKGLPRLSSFSDLPDYLRDNEFIVDFYRPTSSPWDSLRTLWRLHNETGNVWTHLIGERAAVGAPPPLHRPQQGARHVSRGRPRNQGRQRTGM
jgi:hypothetical protein